MGLHTTHLFDKPGVINLGIALSNTLQLNIVLDTAGVIDEVFWLFDNHWTLLYGI